VFKRQRFGMFLLRLRCGIGVCSDVLIFQNLKRRFCE